MHSLTIRNAWVIDGTGRPSFQADVGIRGSTIAEVGRVDGEAERVIDARGLCLSPGFIDVHCHADFNVLDPSNPRDFKLRQGITTEVGGNCGETAAPVNPARLDLLQTFVAFESPREGVLSWEWRTFGEYLDVLSSFDIPTNFVPLIGHGAVRIAVMGFENRTPTEMELGEMRAHVREAMEAGAFGLSVGLGYAPGVYARTPEIVELAREAAAYGGIYATHMRSYSSGIVDSLEESFEVGRRARIPVIVSHINASSSDDPVKIKGALTAMDRARAEGLEVATDVFTSAGTTLRVLLPHWTSEGSLDDLYGRLKDPATRRRIAEEMSRENTSYGRLWRDIHISRVMTEANKRYEGMSVVDASDARGASPAETIMDLVLEERCRVTMFGLDEGEEDLRVALAHPLTMIETDAMGYVEGMPPPGQYGAFTRILGRYVREEKLLSLEEAVRRMTGLPAKVMGLSSKGTVRPDSDADLVVFNPDTVEDRSTFDDPKQHPEGIEYVVVNGQVVVNQGEFTGRMAGTVVRRGS